MTHITKTAAWLLLFACLEVFLFLLVDQPLSLYVREVDAQAPWLMNTFRAYTDFGKSQWYLWPSSIGILFCVITVRSSLLPVASREKISALGKKLVFLFVSVALSGIITDIVKPILGRARPVLLEHEKLYGFRPLSFTSAWNSMPSGHTTTAITLAFVLTLFMPRWRSIWWGLGLLLAISRVMINAHYLSDVLAGAFVALLTVCSLKKALDTDRVANLYNLIFPVAENKLHHELSRQKHPHR